jgi:glycosyltransferase involved in cell wall biosynthesis
MRVAIDGEFLRLPPSGIGGYLRHLLAALRELPGDHLFSLVEPGWDYSGGARGESKSPFADRRVQRAAWELSGFARAANAGRPDLLHVPSFAAPLVSRAPLVVTVHDMIPFMIPAYRQSKAMQANLAIMRRTVRRAALIIAPSHSAAKEIARELPYPASRIRVTHEAADPACHPDPDPVAAAEVRTRFGIPGRYIFNVGGFDIRKNLSLLVEAFAQLRPSLEEPVYLVIAGAPHGGNPAVFPPLQPVIDQCGVGDSVILTGRVSESEKIALYRGAALYVTPSAHEGFGLTALEAMACGVPTVAANASSLPEVVGDGGLLVELDRNALAAAMGGLLGDTDRAARVARRGLERASQFSWQRTAKATLAVYQEIVETRGKG